MGRITDAIIAPGYDKGVVWLRRILAGMCIISLLVSAALIVAIFRSDFVADIVTGRDIPLPSGEKVDVDFRSFERHFVIEVLRGSSAFYTQSSSSGWSYKTESALVLHFDYPGIGPFTFRFRHPIWQGWFDVLIPDWILVLLTGTPTVIWIFFNRRKIHRKWRQLRGLCPECGYDLRATPHRCPECGTVVAANSVPMGQC